MGIARELKIANVPQQWRFHAKFIYELFDEMGHSGASAGMFVSMMGDEPRDPDSDRIGEEYKPFFRYFVDSFSDEAERGEFYRMMKTLLSHMPLTPVELDGPYWVEVEGKGSKKMYQNVRCSRLFKQADSEGNVLSVSLLDGRIDKVYMKDRRTASCYGKHIDIPAEKFPLDVTNMEVQTFHFFDDFRDVCVGSPTFPFELQDALFLKHMSGIEAFTGSLYPNAFSDDVGTVEDAIEAVNDSISKNKCFQEGNTEETIKLLYDKLTDYYYLRNEQGLTHNEAMVSRIFSLMIGDIEEGKVYHDVGDFGISASEVNVNNNDFSSWINIGYMPARQDMYFTPKVVVKKITESGITHQAEYYLIDDCDSDAFLDEERHRLGYPSRYVDNGSSGCNSVMCEAIAMDEDEDHHEG